MIKTEFESGTFYQGDCFEVMKTLADGSIDMVLADLPYGTTQNKWDCVLPLDMLWDVYWAVCSGSVVLTAAQPFTSALVMSQVKRFRYDWTWRKPKGTGHLNAKKMPMRDKEDILIFGKPNSIYNPQFSEGLSFGNKRGRNTESYGLHRAENEVNEGKRYPKQVLEFGVVERGTLHPTQKPVALFEYLIRTYTNEIMTVLDNTAGSGTTAIAAMNANRRWICIEKDPVYYERAVERIRAHELTLKKSEPQLDFA